MVNFLEKEKSVMIKYFVSNLPEVVTIEELLKFYPFISKRSIFRYIKKKKFKVYHFYKIVFIETKSFAEFLFTI